MESEIQEDNPLISALWGVSYVGEMEGGITIGGRAICRLQFTPPITWGGVSINGSAVTKVHLSYTMTGGVNIGGGYDVSGNFVSIAVTMGGKASVHATYALSTQGGATLSGQAIARLNFRHTMTGGITMGGSSGLVTNYSHVARGGIAISGRSVFGISRIITMTGGVSIGGRAVLGAGYRTTSTGGITMSGTAVTLPGYRFTSRGGGVTLSSRATTAFALFYTGAGGVTVAGRIPTPGFNIPYTGSGGVNISGISRALWGKLYQMSGGISLGSAMADLEVGYNYIPKWPHNRIFVFGKATYGRNSYAYTASGGVRMAGVGKPDFCALACDTDIAFYRDQERLSGCYTALDNGTVDYVCARPMEFFPKDSIRSKRPSAILPSATVCRQKLYKKTREKDCSQFIRR